MTGVSRDPYQNRTLPGGFVTDSIVGRGAFAAVYQGFSPAGERVAVKILTRNDPHAEARFAREIKLLRELPKNPNIVAYKGAGTTPEGAPYYAMEFVDGYTLTELLLHGKVDERGACAIIGQLCGGVAELHKLGLAHRDIKPDNVMITRADRQVKLMDFGLVHDAQGIMQLFERERMLEGKDFSTHLEKGVLAGTLEYMAPEQLTDYTKKTREEMRTDTQSDVYSLGIIFYRLLTGRKPFPFNPTSQSGPPFEKEVIQYIQSRVNQQDSDLTQPPEVNAELWSIVATSMSVDPKLRQGDAGMMKLDVERYLLTGAGVSKDRDIAKTLMTTGDGAMGMAGFAQLQDAAAALGIVRPPAKNTTVPPEPVQAPPNQRFKTIPPDEPAAQPQAPLAAHAATQPRYHPRQPTQPEGPRRRPTGPAGGPAGGPVPRSQPTDIAGHHPPQGRTGAPVWIYVVVGILIGVGGILGLLAALGFL